MRCPFCGEDHDRVVDSRHSQDGRVVRRRRECLSCKRKFTTKEYILELPVIVIKADGRREQFSEEKVRKGIEIACNKRPISKDQIEKAVRKIEAEILDSQKHKISSKEIGELVMRHLREMDEVAYVRFASVYRKFKDTQEFLQELHRLKGK
ncbi:transcriptional regulator NrdR [candidate division KSB1 bacterium]|nr:transcriptional repressor NrdR [bacterium]OQX59415.1 MAG: transcriptional regulator NrdR [candidate division KSB1 bacterium 4484_219]RKY77596.1 MAG: transcriptional regulator NrdR [candidate division KSB1 bacterium]RKY79264.1 MAG: transcriptional regulator NrdR [candidate division KSB1 bacterium]RKY87479.1 MAG: transcriptional regulator NrdR [candidate division KSB1 bacterium]